MVNFLKNSAASLRVFCIWCLVLSWTLMVSAPAAGKENAALISLVKGPVMVELNDGRRFALKTGDRIIAGQTIVTGAGGQVEYQFQQGEKFLVYEKSRVLVGELLPEEDSSYSLSVFLGRLTMFLKKIKGNDMIITPTMTCGVRGTEFSVAVADDGASIVSVERGRVAVSTDRNETAPAEIAVEAGQEVQVDLDGEQLKTRPITIRTQAEYDEFRRKRLETLIPRLPQMLKMADIRLGELLSGLENTRTLIVSTTENIGRLAKDFQEKQEKKTQERREKIVRLRMENLKLQRQLRRFRVKRTRINGLFIRGEVIKDYLPEAKERLGDGYNAVREGLDKFLENKDRVASRVRASSLEVKNAMQSISPILKQIKRANRLFFRENRMRRLQNNRTGSGLQQDRIR